MQLFRLCLPDIIRSKVYTFSNTFCCNYNFSLFFVLVLFFCFCYVMCIGLLQISIWKKFNMIFLFFLLRKLILPFYSFTLFCIILPMTMFIPEAELPAWVVCYIPATMSFLNILPAPKSFPFIVPYLLFENTMSVTKFNAMISGLFQLGSAYEWVVTKKSGRSSEGDLVSLVQKETKHQRGSSEPNLDELKEEIMQQDQKAKKKRKHNRIYMKELALAFLLLTASARSLLSAQGIHFYFLLFQGISFLLVGLDLIGEQVQWRKHDRFCEIYCRYKHRRLGWTTSIWLSLKIKFTRGSCTGLGVLLFLIAPNPSEPQYIAHPIWGTNIVLYGQKNDCGWARKIQ